MSKDKKVDQTKTDSVPARVPPPVNMDDELLSPALPGESEPANAADAAMQQSAAPAPAAPAGAFMTAADIAEIVKAAVAGVTAASSQATAEAISRALTQHMGQRRLTVAEIGEPKTPFNPTGAKRELQKEFFQNGAPIMERFVSDAEIEMLHKLVPGSYGPEDFPIVVAEKKRLNGKSRVFIIHSDGKDDRLRMKNYAPNFHALLVRLVQEAKDQRAQRRAEARALLADDGE